MKRFRFSFLALVAIVATSFTVASHQGVFKRDPNVPDGCYKDITAGGIPFGLGDVNGHPGGSSPCTANATATKNGTTYYCYGSGGSGTPVFGVVSQAGSAVNKAADCTATTQACCYEVENDRVVRICYKP